MKPIIDIILDGKIFGQRNWEIIPRAGDTILLKDGEIYATVKQVVWGDDSRAAPHERQWVQIVCTKDEL